MWVNPQKTVLSVVDHDPNHRVWWLAGIYGFPLLLNLAQTLSLASSFSLLAILISSLILAAPLGMLSFMIMSVLIQWTGRWLGGSATYHQIRASVAWSNVTNIGSIVLWLILALSFGGQIFYKNFPETPFTGSSLVLVGVVFFLFSALSVWSFVLLFRSLAAVQRFSSWRAIINVILPFVIVTVALWALMIFVCWALGMKS